MESFFNSIAQLTRLTEEGQNALAAIINIKEVNKGDILIRENTVCNYVYYIEKGLTRTFYYKDGKDVTDWISMDGDFATSIVSFISRKPDRRIIEALENSTLYALHHDKLEELYSQYHDIERLGRLLVNNGLIQMQQRFDDLHFASAKERYNQLMQTRPNLIQRVPLGHIASFLGVTQETLSRIRGQA